MPPRVSVIVPTYNRVECLAALLESLARQTLLPGQYEVIVVDDGSSDGTSDLLTRYQDQLTNLKVVSQSNCGAARARNAGLRIARGEIVAFTDSDCVASPDWLEKLLCRLDSGPDAIGVEGRTVSIAERIGPFTHQVVNETGGVYATCNMAYRREIIEMIGGFDEDFFYGHEDTELSLRARTHGQIVFASGAVVVHPPLPISFRRFLDLMKIWVENELILYRKSASRYRSDHNCGPLWIVVMWLGVRVFFRQLAAQAPWLGRDPVLFLKYFAAVVCQRIYLALLVPWFLCRLVLFELSHRAKR